MQLLPYEDVIYIADSANCPYGEKSQDEIIQLCKRITDFLLEQSCKLIVVACNTATAAAIDYLRSHYTIPFVGMEPAVKPAALNSKTGVVGILATAGTFRGRLFNETKKRFASSVTVIERVGEGLVEAVEKGELSSESTKALLRSHIEPMLQAGIDHLALGCTHYPFLLSAIKEITGDKVTVIDPAPAVVKHVQQILSEKYLLNSNTHPASYTFYSSGTGQTLAAMLNEMGVKNYTLEEKKNFTL